MLALPEPRPEDPTRSGPPIGRVLEHVEFVPLVLEIKQNLLERSYPPALTLVRGCHVAALIIRSKGGNSCRGSCSCRVQVILSRPRHDPFINRV